MLSPHGPAIIKHCPPPTAAENVPLPLLSGSVEDAVKSMIKTENSGRKETSDKEAAGSLVSSNSKNPLGSLSTSSGQQLQQGLNFTPASDIMIPQPIFQFRSGSIGDAKLGGKSNLFLCLYANSFHIVRV